MARGAPVTIDDVEATLRIIEGAGLKPTVRLVHQRLGRGSLSTITAHLRAVAASRAETDVGPLPDPVVATLRAMADTLWQELADAADTRIDTVTAAADARVREAHGARDVAQAALADVSDERGALIATLAERGAERTALEQARESLAGTLAAAERQAALDERDRAALAARLDDRDAELQRTYAARERGEAALLGMTGERDRAARALDVELARREVEGAAHEQALVRLREALEASRTEAAALATTQARVEAQLEAQGVRTRELATHAETRRRERDTALERASALDDRLERAHQALAESRRSADDDRQTVVALRADVERLELRVRDTGIDVAPLSSPPSSIPGTGSVGRPPDSRTSQP